MVNQPAVDVGGQTFPKLFLAHLTAQDVDAVATQRGLPDERLEEAAPFPLDGV